MTDRRVHVAAARVDDADDAEHRVLHLAFGVDNGDEQVIVQLDFETLDDRPPDDRNIAVAVLQVAPLRDSADQAAARRFRRRVDAEHLDACDAGPERQ